MAKHDCLIPKKTNECVFGTNVPVEAVRGCLCLRNETWKWFLPWFCAGLGWYCQSVGLHWATYQYVHKYAEDNKTLAASEGQRTLYDSFEEGPAVKIDMHTIDMIAALIPMCFVVLTFFAVSASSKICFCCSRSSAEHPQHPQHAYLLRQNVLRIWTKVMTCAMFLFMCKGTLGAITVVPDSSGWDVCENRLKAVGTEWMRQEHSFADMLSIDVIWVSEHHTPLRYCADMMFSGHTFVVTLFALGTYDLMRAFRLETLGRRFKNPTTKARVKMLSLSIFACLILFEQIVEIAYVERSHFHYSMDILMAVILTFLIYTNGVIAVFAKQWSAWGLLVFVSRKTTKKHDEECGDDCQEDEEVALHRIWRCADEHPELTAMTDPLDPKWALLNSKGDIFIPPCCVPFCCLAGREHVYSDEGVETLIQMFADGQNPKQDPKVIRKYLENTMLLDDGVSWREFKSAVRPFNNNKPSQNEMRSTR
ncbi:unnamed protein product [Prorocentrum cordatum]|uniref:Sphingomyelin synthase-like domain-containing protein n=1 Tax=Prorocentrum cordatum TaxID=2364126 RepID=A0ABN9RSB7_9DINO|nr:unnamed protein product [Polarella glacialis]